ncbi:MAG: hypothetical protein IT489_05240 [Gammaproteobacteria bacterium]|nr:hypothetical protein [Gammaproteobacteria bacterium]
MVLRRMVFLLLLVMVWPAQADSGEDPGLTEARTVFLRGVDGDKRAVRDAVQRFKTLSRAHAGEPVFQAYLGAAMTLQGRDAPNNIEKGRITEEGLGVLDRALDAQMAKPDPGSVHTLDTMLVAANTYIHLPAFFNRYQQGKDLLQKILAHPDFDGMAPGYKAAAYLAQALVSHGDADDEAYRRYLELTVGADPKGRDGEFAGKRLQELTDVGE